MDKDLIPRDKYLDEILAFKNTDLVKVVTGLRRCGKSSLLQLALNHLQENREKNDVFISINLEQLNLGIGTARELHNYCIAQASNDGKTYLFIDEVQRVDGWHDAVNSLRVSIDCDIYVTGSNAFLMSSDIATYLSGRYVEISVLPLVFKEYLSFCGMHTTKSKGILEDGNGERILSSEILERYLTYGGMPAIASLDTTRSMHQRYFASLYEAIVKRDVLQRGRGEKLQLVTDDRLLKTLCEYLSDNIGNITSPTRISNSLTDGGLKTTNKTVQAYIGALAGAFILYPCKRYDLHGKAILKTNEKYYLVDPGLRAYLDGYRGSDTGRLLENVVYLQLLYEGYSVHIGKLYNREVDFVANKDGKIVYVQVADNLYSKSTLERELSPLVSIKDNHEKWIIVGQGERSRNIDGIKIIPAIDFLLGE